MQIDNDLLVTGANYPVATHYQAIGVVFNFLWYVGLIMVFGGNMLLASIKDEPLRNILKKMLDFANTNKFGILLSLWILNNIATNLQQSGAFEVYFNDDLIYSKLGTSMVPTLQEIIFLVKKSKSGGI